jgi:hypothetical protein
LSATARVYYSFHPHANQTFKVLQRASGKAGQVTVELSAGKTLTLPLWMLQPEAALLQLSPTVDISVPILLEIVDLVRANCSALKPLSDALEPTDGSTQLSLSQR